MANENQASTQLPPLQIKCEHCKGERNPTTGEWCAHCHGRGVVPTDAGKAVLEFVRMNWLDVAPPPLTPLP